MYILHLPSWFPEADKPFTGNFIEKHIDAISLFQDSITLKVVKSYDCRPKMTDEIISPKNRVITFYLSPKNGIIGRLLNKTLTKYYYFKGIIYIYKNYGIPALIHIHVAYPMGGLALFLKRIWEVPIILTEHWSVYHAENWRQISSIKQRKIKHLLKNIDGLTTVSNHLMQSIKSKRPVSHGFIISNVVNTDLFVPDSVVKEKTQMIHISTLEQKSKNIMGILKVISEIMEIRDDFVLHIISEFENPEAIQYVKDHQLEPFVEFLGSMPEQQVATTLREHHFLLLFSNYENQPCVILEAFSCALPVIATTVGGIPEIVNQERGVLVPRKDEKAFKDAILKMLDEHTQYNKIDIREYAVHNFSPDQIGKAFHQIYKMFLAY